MKQQVRPGRVFPACLAAALCVAASPVWRAAARACAPPVQKVAQSDISPKHKKAFAAFEARVKEYVALRERVGGKMPKLSKDATPEQIEAHKTAFQEAVRAARASAKPGDLFTAEVARHMREVVKSELKPTTRQEVRQTVLEAEVKGVPLRVNYPYPETEELIEMPPTLLLKLPQLPQQVRYRYVGRSLLLVDRENGLIIDFMPDALP
jgi:ABC-type transporter MlaC component